MIDLEADAEAATDEDDGPVELAEADAPSGDETASTEGPDGEDEAQDERNGTETAPAPAVQELETALAESKPGSAADAAEETRSEPRRTGWWNLRGRL